MATRSCTLASRHVTNLQTNHAKINALSYTCMHVLSAIKNTMYLQGKHVCFSWISWAALCKPVQSNDKLVIVIDVGFTTLF